MKRSNFVDFDLFIGQTFYMKQDTISEVLLQMQNEIQALIQNQSWVGRQVASEFQELLPSKFIKVVMGVRRSGKSTLAVQGLKEEEFLYLNFDDEVLSQITAEQLQLTFETALSLNTKAKYIVLDEIQNILRWEFFVNKLQRRGYNLIVTGSNSRLLSSELATHLTGRQVNIELFPFSFKEFLEFKKQRAGKNLISSGQIDVIQIQKMDTSTRAILKNYFDEYFQKGGFPELLDIDVNSSLRRNYLKELYDKIITRDIVQRRKIKNIRAIKEIAYLILSQYSAQFTYQNIKKAIELKSVSTVKNYIEYLQESYLGFVLEPYSHKVKERISLPKKFYAIDVGLLNVLLGSAGSDLGRKLENIVFLELRRQRLELYYIKEPQYEVDFAIREGRKIIKLIQVCWSLEDHKTKDRELKSLVQAAVKYNVKELEIITFDTEGTESIDGYQIKVRPIWKWLLA